MSPLLLGCSGHQVSDLDLRCGGGELTGSKRLAKNHSVKSPVRSRSRNPRDIESGPFLSNGWLHPSLPAKTAQRDQQKAH